MKYLVKRPLRHDGARYAPGEAVELDVDAAAALIAFGVVEGGVRGQGASPPRATPRKTDAVAKPFARKAPSEGIDLDHLAGK